MIIKLSLTEFLLKITIIIAETLKILIYSIKNLICVRSTNQYDMN